MGGEEGEEGFAPIPWEVLADPINSAQLIPFHGAHSQPLSSFGCSFPRGVLLPLQGLVSRG